MVCGADGRDTHLRPPQSLELNHVPHKYNEDADELAKIASGRTTAPPNIFARDITKPSAEFKDPAEPGLSSTGSPGGNPPGGRGRAHGH